MADDYSSEMVETIHAVPAEDWDSTIGSAIGACHALLACYESAPLRTIETRYVLLSAKGRLQATCVAAIIGSNEVGISRTVLGRVAEKLPVKNWFAPALICGLWGGPGAPVLVRPGNDRRLWIQRIVDSLEAYAEREGLSVCFSSVISEQTELITELRQRGYCDACALPQAMIEVTWQDQHTYLEMLRSANKNHHAAARTEINRFQRSGISITEWNGEDEPSLYRLFEKHHYGRNAYPFELPKTFLSRVKGDLGDDCIAYVARKGEALAGVCVVLKRNGYGILWRVGIDHEVDGGNFTYFNLTYYHVFREAPAHGITRFSCGNGALMAKVRRGCQVSFAHLFYKPNRRSWRPLVRLLFVLQRRWYGKKFAPYLAPPPADSTGTD